MGKLNLLAGNYLKIKDVYKDVKSITYIKISHISFYEKGNSYSIKGLAVQKDSTDNTVEYTLFEHYIERIYRDNLPQYEDEISSITYTNISSEEFNNQVKEAIEHIGNLL